MKLRMFVSALAGALAVVALLGAYQFGRIDRTTDTVAPAAVTAQSSMDGLDVFDSDGSPVGVVEQTVAARQGERTARFAMVRISRGNDAGLRLAVPVHRLQPVEDGLMLSLEVDEEGEFRPTVAQLRSRT